MLVLVSWTSDSIFLKVVFVIFEVGKIMPDGSVNRQSPFPGHVIRFQLEQHSLSLPTPHSLIPVVDKGYLGGESGIMITLLIFLLLSIFSTLQ